MLGTLTKLDAFDLDETEDTEIADDRKLAEMEFTISDSSVEFVTFAP